MNRSLLATLFLLAVPSPAPAQNLLTNATFDNNGAGLGGGLSNDSSDNVLTLTNVMFSGNTAAQSGGGLANFTGLVALTNVTIDENTAHSDGGGLFNDEDGVALLTNVTLSNNDASGDGGGLYHAGESLIVANSTLSGNSADDSGGGLLNKTTALLIGVTLNGNSATRGGGLYNDVASTATLNNVTVSANGANQGGGLYNFEGTANLTNVTVTGNTGSLDGGGILLDGGTVTVKNSIVANSPVGGNCSGGVTNSGFNLANDNTCGFTQVTNVLLGPLTYNGGPTMTHRPMAGSLAINFVTAGCPPPAADQRGAPRPAGGPCDAGSVETGAILPMQYLPLVVKN